MSNKQTGNKTVFVTGASGRIGSKVVLYLLEKGYSVRALSSRIQFPIEGVEWVFRDLRRADLNFESEVEGCIAVLHLGAEMKNTEDMPFINGAATGGIARAVEAMGVPFMAYVSSVAVYGSSKYSVRTECDPTINHDREVPGETTSIPWMKVYSRTKLMGEKAIIDVAKSSEYVIFRPTVIVDIDDVVSSISPSRLNLALRGRRNTHHIYVLDVAAALVWAMERALDRKIPSPGVSIYNLSDESTADLSYAAFWAQAAEALGESKPKRSWPKILDLSIEYIRHSFGRPYFFTTPHLRFPATRLMQEGFKHPYGMNNIRARAYSIVKQKRLNQDNMNQ